jgi:hypothetical protein
MDVDRRDGHYLCFPDICVTRGGRLVLVYREADQHVAGRRKLLVRTSDDQGANWSEPFPLNAAGGHCPRIVTLSDGQLVLVDDDPHILYWSLDEGRNWMRHPCPGFTHGIPDRLLELDENTFLTVAQWSKGAQPHPAMGQPPIEQMLYRSTNRGASFTPYCVLPSAPRLALCETSLCRLPDGRLLALMRENSQVFEPMYACLSEDQGKTWSDPWPTPLIGHRPTLGVTRSGKLLVTYRNVGPDQGTAAWLGEVEELIPTSTAWGCERLESPGFQVHGLTRPHDAVSFDSEGLHIRIEEKKEDNELGPAAFYALRPLSDPACATAVLEAEVRVFSGQRNHCGLRLGFWWRISADRITPERPGARPVRLSADRGNVLRLEYREGCVTLYVNNRKRRSYALEPTVAARPIVFGTVGGRGENAGQSLWRRLRLDIREPRLLRRTQWSWSSEEGAPDAWAQRRVLELANARGASAGDFGYTGWAEYADGAFLCAYHHADGASSDYIRGQSSRLRVTHFFESDFS